MSSCGRRGRTRARPIRDAIVADKIRPCETMKSAAEFLHHRFKGGDEMTRWDKEICRLDRNAFLQHLAKFPNMTEQQKRTGITSFAYHPKALDVKASAPSSSKSVWGSYKIPKKKAAKKREEDDEVQVLPVRLPDMPLLDDDFDDDLGLLIEKVEGSDDSMDTSCQIIEPKVVCTPPNSPSSFRKPTKSSTPRKRGELRAQNATEDDGEDEDAFPLPKRALFKALVETDASNLYDRIKVRNRSISGKRVAQSHPSQPDQGKSSKTAIEKSPQRDDDRANREILDKSERTADKIDTTCEEVDKSGEKKSNEEEHEEEDDDLLEIYADEDELFGHHLMEDEEEPVEEKKQSLSSSAIPMHVEETNANGSRKSSALLHLQSKLDADSFNRLKRLRDRRICFEFARRAVCSEGYNCRFSHEIDTVHIIVDVFRLMSSSRHEKALARVRSFHEVTDQELLGFWVLHRHRLCSDVGFFELFSNTLRLTGGLTSTHGYLELLVHMTEDLEKRKFTTEVHAFANDIVGQITEIAEFPLLSDDSRRGIVTVVVNFVSFALANGVVMAQIRYDAAFDLLMKRRHPWSLKLFHYFAFLPGYRLTSERLWNVVKMFCKASTPNRDIEDYLMPAILKVCGAYLCRQRLEGDAAAIDAVVKKGLEMFQGPGAFPETESVLRALKASGFKVNIIPEIMETDRHLPDYAIPFTQAFKAEKWTEASRIVFLHDRPCYAETQELFRRVILVYDVLIESAGDKTSSFFSNALLKRYKSLHAALQQHAERATERAFVQQLSASVSVVLDEWQMSFDVREAPVPVCVNNWLWSQLDGVKHDYGRVVVAVMRHFCRGSVGVETIAIFEFLEQHFLGSDLRNNLAQWVIDSLLRQGSLKAEEWCDVMRFYNNYVLPPFKAAQKTVPVAFSGKEMTVPLSLRRRQTSELFRNDENFSRIIRVTASAVNGQRSLVTAFLRQCRTALDLGCEFDGFVCRIIVYFLASQEKSMASQIADLLEAFEMGVDRSVFIDEQFDDEVKKIYVFSDLAVEEMTVAFFHALNALIAMQVDDEDIPDLVVEFCSRSKLEAARMGRLPDFLNVYSRTGRSERAKAALASIDPELRLVQQTDKRFFIPARDIIMFSRRSGQQSCRKT